MDRFLDELFPFMQHPEIPSENDAAERAVWPTMIAREASSEALKPTAF